MGWRAAEGKCMARGGGEMGLLAAEGNGEAGGGGEMGCARGGGGTPPPYPYILCDSHIRDVEFFCCVSICQWALAVRFSFGLRSTAYRQTWWGGG